ncbi:MAG: hypothetical protein EB117_11410 [Betaproteobacteria bacterium]|nr:hypothetical protein [Betaproteobacteria bacterium]
MPIEQIFETKEEAPEFLRNALLETEDGKFKFQAELPQEVGNLKRTLDKERKARAEYEAKLKQYDGIDLDQYQAVLKAQEEAKARQARSAGDWETREQHLKAQLEADLRKRESHYSAEISGRDAKIALMQNALERSLIEAQATAAISAAKGTPELLLPHVMQRVKIFEEDGDYVVKVLDQSGQPRIADIKGSPFTIKHLIEEMKSDPVYGRAFEASGAGGSGAQTGNRAGGNAKTMSRANFDALTPSAKMEYVRGGGLISDQ